jgi:hypothetical protein
MKRHVWWLACCLACSAPSGAPELTARRHALEAWERGRAALDAGDGPAALAAFQEALDHRPGDPLLLAWRGQAEAARGDLDAAIRTLQVVLSREPKMAEARYNLACYQARAGQLDAAGESLQQALADGAADPRDVLEDPDFAPHLRHAALAFLPDAPLDVAVSGPSGSVFLGSEAPIRLTVRGRRLEQLQVTSPPVVGPFELVKVEERHRTTEGGDHERTITWYLSVTGAGHLDVGPFEVRSERRAATALGLSVAALAPPGHVAPEGSTTRLEVPSVLASHGGGDLQSPAAWAADGRLVVRAGPDDRVVADGAAGPGVRWQHFQGRDLDWALTTWPAPTSPQPVRVLRRGKVVLDVVVKP